MLQKFDNRLTTEQARPFVEVDEIISRAVTIGDPMLAFEYGKHLMSGMKLKSYTLAKLLWRLQESWDLFRAGGIDDDLLSMADTQMGIAPATTQKYIRMWQSIFMNDDIPDEVKDILLGRPIADTLLLTGAAADGSLTSDEMKEAALTPDQYALKELIRKKRGERTSSTSAIRLYIYMRDRGDTAEGTVVARQGDESEELFTFNKVNTEFAEKAIERIIRAVGMQELY